MDFFEKELRGMFEKHQLLKEQKYCGNVLLAKLDGELRVKLQFVTQGTAEKYTALAATVINRTDGTVDKHYWQTNGWTEYARSVRVDGRSLRGTALVHTYNVRR